MTQHQHKKLSPSQVEAALLSLETLPIDEDSKRVLRDIVMASANPDSERPDVVITTLEPDRQEQIVSLMDELMRDGNGVMVRGADALNALSESEWGHLLNA